MALLVAPVLNAQTGFLYSTNELGGTVSGYAMDTATGALSLLAGSPFSPPAPCNLPIATTPDLKRLYCAAYGFGTGSSITGFDISPTGTLSPTKWPPFTGVPPALGVFDAAMHPSGKFVVFSASHMDSPNVWVFSIDQYSGALSPVAGTPFFTTSATGAPRLKFAPSGTFLYAAYSYTGSIDAFRFETTTGSLVKVATYPAPSTSGTNTNGMDIDRTGRFLYAAYGNRIYGFALDQGSGALAALPGSPYATSHGWDFKLTDAAIEPAGRFLYVGGQGAITAFAIDQVSGALSLLPGSPFLVGQYSIALAADPSGRYLYSSSYSESRMRAFFIADSGALVPVPGSPFEGVQAPRRLAILASAPGDISVTQHRPDRGGNAGIVTVDVFGYGFQAGAEPRLRGGGGPDIVGQGTSVSNHFHLRTTFDLTGAQAGQWDVIVRNPDGASASLDDSFTIEEGGGPEIWVDVIGRSQIRGGRGQDYTITYGNRGNVDSAPFRIWASFPTFINWETNLQFPPSSTGTLGDAAFVAFDIPAAAPGATGVVPIRLTAPDTPDLGHRLFEVQAWRERK